jgi:hypothetical protein
MSDNDLWYVKTADGDVDRMTLDQLDEAFNGGHIDENVMVLPAGEETWVKLSTLLGLDQPAPAPVALPPTPTAFALPPSLRPVSLDLSDDLDGSPFQKKSRKGVVLGGLVGAVALAGVIFAAVHSAGQIDSSTATASIAAPPPATAAPAPPPVAPSPAATTTAAPLPDHGLTDDQKAKLAAADKALQDKVKSKKKARGAGIASHGGGKIKSQGFTTGGNKYDPLNANL